MAQMTEHNQPADGRTGSFPYFNIARDFGVPYSEVLAMVDDLEINGLPIHQMSTDWGKAVLAAWDKENARRREAC